MLELNRPARQSQPQRQVREHSSRRSNWLRWLIAITAAGLFLLCLTARAFTADGPALTGAMANRPPVATDDSYSVLPINGQLNVSAPGVLTNDTDADGDQIQAQLVSGAAHGTVLLSSDGRFIYMWAGSFRGTDSFTYRVYDGTDTSNTATVSILVIPNRPPIAIADSYTVAQGQTLIVAPPGVLMNDIDPDFDHLLAHFYKPPAHGSVNFSLNGGFSYTPDVNFSGIDSFTYRADDGSDTRSNEATVTITVTPGPITTTIEFSEIGFDITEDTAFANITVSRSGDLEGTSTVEFITSDESALQSTDYTFAAGLIVFGKGQSTKTVEVLVSEDTYVEGDEWLILTLRNPIGATLGSPSTTTLHIVDDDTNAPVANPINESAGLVRQLYHDSLNRECDPGGLSYWVNEIESCGSDQACINARRVRVADAFFVESEFQDNGGFLQRVYQAGFGSPPAYNQYMIDLGELSGPNAPEQALRNALETGVIIDESFIRTLAVSSKDQFLNRFVLRPEFIARYPLTLTALQYVDSLNVNTANSLTQSERDALVSGLTSGNETRASVLRLIAENSVFVERQYNPSFVLSLYFAQLRRDPDPGGFQFWLDKINLFPPHSGAGQHSLFCAFLTSQEYQMRFSSVVTRSNADCGP